MVRNVFKSRIFQLSPIAGTGSLSDLALHPEILTPKQILQRLPIALAQVKAGKTCENLLKEIRQIILLCIKQMELLKKA